MSCKGKEKSDVKHIKTVYMGYGSDPDTLFYKGDTLVFLRYGKKPHDTIFFNDRNSVVYLHDTIYRNPPKEKYKQIPYKIIKHYSGWADPRVSPQSWLGTDSFFRIETYTKPSEIQILEPSHPFRFN